MIVFHSDIEQAKQKIEELKESYLLRWGWISTCNTPGSCWLWRRDFSNEDAERHSLWKSNGPGPLGWPSEPRPYGVITAPIDLAVSMTARGLDYHPEQNSEEDLSEN
jgi:hypothetical protein